MIEIKLITSTVRRKWSIDEKRQIIDMSDEKIKIHERTDHKNLEKN